MIQTDAIASLIEDLVDDLEDEKCVLLLGPEIIQIEQKSLIRHIHGELLKVSSDDILYYYEQDSLFLFQGANGKLNAPRRIQRIYRKLEVEDRIFRKILEIPFHLIISLNPDLFLPDCAVRYGVPHHFRYFRFSGENSGEVPLPEKHRPLIYNLCGCIKEDESLLLDYEDLFRLLRSVLGPNSLPPKLRKKLREARSFLFLGFDFEKWYTQLLLQLLTGERKGSRKLALDTALKAGAAKDFLLFQFNIEFLESGQSFFKSLYQLCEKRNGLRKLKEAIEIDSKLINRMKKMVADNNIEEVMTLLERVTVGTQLYDKAVLLRGRFNEWGRKYHGGTLLEQEAEVFMNQMREELVMLINQIEHE